MSIPAANDPGPALVVRVMAIRGSRSIPCSISMTPAETSAAEITSFSVSSRLRSSKASRMASRSSIRRLVSAGADLVEISTACSGGPGR